MCNQTNSLTTSALRRLRRREGQRTLPDPHTVAPLSLIHISEPTRL